MNTKRIYNHTLVLITGLMLALGAAACGDTSEEAEPANSSSNSDNDSNNDSDSNSDTAECLSDSDCAGENMFCAYFDGRTCEEDIYAADTRTGEAVISLDEDRYWFDEIASCSEYYRGSKGGVFAMTAEMLEAEAGSVFTLDDGLYYPGRTSDENSSFNYQAVSGMLEITARSEGTLEGTYRFEVKDLDGGGNSGNNGGNNGDPDLCQGCTLTEGTFVALICTP